MNLRTYEGRAFRKALTAGLLAGSVVLSCYPATAGHLSDPPVTAGSKDKSAREPVKITLQLLRTDTMNASDTNGATVTVGTPILTTLDGSTATISVTGEDLSYTLGFSPKIESRGKMVQILWSIRLAGKSLPGGTTGLSMTGASQVVPDATAGIAEISLADPATGRRSVFHVQGVTSIGDAAGTVRSQDLKISDVPTVGH